MNLLELMIEKKYIFFLSLYSIEPIPEPTNRKKNIFFQVYSIESILELTNKIKNIYSFIFKSKKR